MLRLTKSIFVDLFLYMMTFGFGIGFFFPAFIHVFLDIPREKVFQLSFFSACVGAGILVGLFNFLLVKVVLGNRFSELVAKMQNIAKTLTSMKRTEECSDEDCFITLNSNDVIGQTVENYNGLIFSLRKRIHFENLIWRYVGFINRNIDLNKLSLNIIREFIEDSELQAGACLIFQENGTTRLGACLGINESEINRQMLMAPSGILDRAIKTKRSFDIFIEDNHPVTIGCLGIDFKPNYFLVYPVVYHGAVISAFIFIGFRQPAQEIKDIMDVIFPQVGYAIQNSLLHERVKKISIIDELTNTYNRRYGLERLKEEFARAVRTSSYLSVVMADIDYFKSINDTYGHLAGDIALKEISAIFKKNLREGDILIRYGGEEFLIIYIGANIEDATVITERLRTTVEHTDFFWEKHIKIHLTISFGISCYPAFMVDSELELLQQADNALYQSKERGRNQLTIWNPDDAS